jgi:hypothetical protein
MRGLWHSSSLHYANSHGSKTANIRASKQVGYSSCAPNAAAPAAVIRSTIR